MKRLMPLLVFALLASGSARAEGSNTLACTLTPSLAGCYIERPALSLGALSVSFGVDGQAAWAVGRSSHLAPYALIAWAEDAWEVWVEVALPGSRVPVLGRPDPWRVGFAVRF